MRVIRRTSSGKIAKSRCTGGVLANNLACKWCNGYASAMACICKDHQVRCYGTASLGVAGCTFQISRTKCTSALSCNETSSTSYTIGNDGTIAWPSCGSTYYQSPGCTTTKTTTQSQHAAFTIGNLLCGNVTVDGGPEIPAVMCSVVGNSRVFTEVQTCTATREDTGCDLNPITCSLTQLNFIGIAGSIARCWFYAPFDATSDLPGSLSMIGPFYNNASSSGGLSAFPANGDCVRGSASPCASAGARALITPDTSHTIGATLTGCLASSAAVCGCWCDSGNWSYNVCYYDNIDAACKCHRAGKCSQGWADEKQPY
jgi:hypothetical protein